MTTSSARAVLGAARTYVVRMLPMHVLSYPLAFVAAWAAVKLLPGTPRSTNAASELTASAVALCAFAGAWLVVNFTAHRWSLVTAAGRLVASSAWVEWVVVRLLERATPRDRRGTAAIVPVAMQLLTGDSTGSRVSRFALDRMGASAIARVADTLGGVPMGDAPISERVHKSLELGVAQDSRRAGLGVAAVIGAILVLAIAAATRA